MHYDFMYFYVKTFNAFSVFGTCCFVYFYEILLCVENRNIRNFWFNMLAVEVRKAILFILLLFPAQEEFGISENSAKHVRST